MRANHYTMVAKNAIKSSLRNVSKNDTIGIGCSGGADSLALLCALSTLYKSERASLVHVVIVDHQLQEVTADVSADTAELAESFGFIPHIIPVDVVTTGEGSESDARKVRYQAFDSVIREHNLAAFLIGHTKTDQAEQVFLSLLRGSGTRSLAGIPKSRGICKRPFLDVLSRIDTQNVCKENNVKYWCDPHNESLEYKRVSVRKLISNTEQATGQDIVNPLVKTAQISAEDADALDFYVDKAYSYSFRTSPVWSIDALKEQPKAVRKRMYRRKLMELGSFSDTVSFEITNRIDDFIEDWHGQGAVAASNGVTVGRESRNLVFSAD